MKIVADKDIFQVEESFSSFGELVLIPGREIQAEHVRDAQALLVRTVTGVNETLVGGSALRFIGSAASGTDHVDLDFLEANGIRFSHAPGCNADAVVDYVFASLAWLAAGNGENWRNNTVGIIGAGNVGSRLAKKMLALGMRVRVFDPLLSESHFLAGRFDSLDNVLTCDIVSMHVPLTRAGQYPTWHMMDERNIAGLAAGATLINAARGEVVDNARLAEILHRRKDLRVVLDVWESEPGINPDLLSAVKIATPHIAGYSRNGKRNGTRAVRQAFCEFFDLGNAAVKENASAGMLDLPGGIHDAEKLNAAIVQAYAINQDFLDTRNPDLAAHFDKRRNGYEFRQEFSDYRFSAEGLTQSLANDLAALGFRAT